MTGTLKINFLTLKSIKRNKKQHLLIHLKLCLHFKHLFLISFKKTYFDCIIIILHKYLLLLLNFIYKTNLYDLGNKI